MAGRREGRRASKKKTGREGWLRTSKEEERGMAGRCRRRRRRRRRRFQCFTRFQCEAAMKEGVLANHGEMQIGAKTINK